jgi:hypothetical protein
MRVAEQSKRAAHVARREQIIKFFDPTARLTDAKGFLTVWNEVNDLLNPIPADSEEEDSL